MQRSQSRLEGRASFVIRIGRGAHAHHRAVQLNGGGGERGQTVQCRQPSRQVAVALGVEMPRYFRFEAVGPGREFTVAPALGQRGEVDHLSATSEAKLKH